MTTIANDLQEQINQAEAAVKALREKLAQEKNHERVKALTLVKELIKEHQLNIKELGLGGKKSILNLEFAPKDKRTIVAPKYQDPSSGKTWTGRGKTPSWLATYLSTGHNKEDYLIK